MTKHVNQESGDNGIQIGDDVHGGIHIHQDPSKVILIVGGFFVVIIALILAFWPDPPVPSQQSIAIDTEPSPTVTTPISENATLKVVEDATPELVEDDPITPTPATPTTSTQTPLRGFQDNCIYSSFWATYPNRESTTDTGNCLVASNMGFSVQDQSLDISVQNPGSNERYGLYSPIYGNVLIEFDLRIDEMETTIDNELVSLGVGIISLNPIDTETDGFIFYVIESPNTGYPIYLKEKERGGFDQYIIIDGNYVQYTPGTNQKISLLLNGNHLAIYVNAQLVRETTLTFEERAFFIGYKFENMGKLTARVSNFSIQDK